MGFYNYIQVRHSNNSLSENFSEWEFIYSNVAIVHKIDNRFVSSKHRKNAVNLCNNFLEPLRTLAGGVPLFVSSGYRVPSLNHMVGGVSYSEHQKGNAVDIVGYSVSGRELFYLILSNVKKNLPLVDQVIYYPQKGFIHVGFSDFAPRGEFFVATRDRYYLKEVVK